MKTKLLRMGGFTLVELMIVVAIIGILASVAIPQYQDYTRNALVQAALSEANQYKTAIALCAQRNLMTECDSGSNGIPNARGKVSAVADGVINVIPGGPFGTSQTLRYTPDQTGSTWALSCQSCSGSPNLSANFEFTNHPDKSP